MKRILTVLVLFALAFTASWYALAGYGTANYTEVGGAKWVVHSAAPRAPLRPAIHAAAE